MGVYINMEMPKDGSCIQIVIDDDGKVYPSVEKCILKMGSIAKAVPVPPHGRLIDADAFFKKGLAYAAPELLADGEYVLAKLKYAPTVIPADDSKEE